MNFLYKRTEGGFPANSHILHLNHSFPVAAGFWSETEPVLLCPTDTAVISMNKTLLLLLVTLVHSQSDGILLPVPVNSDDNFQKFHLKDWLNSEIVLSDDVNNLKSQSHIKRSGNDVLMRRSALDKNFMRFGRNAADAKINYREETFLPSARTKFFRFGRGYKDNFIRFGRGSHENFIRFGRGGKDNFIRFGRGVPEDFFRSGKSLRESFIRFGRPDRNFMRVEQGNQEIYGDDCDNQYILDENPFEKNKKAIKTQDNFIRFGKSGNQKDGRNGTNFLRFGKKETSNEIADTETEDSDFNEKNEDELLVIKNKRQTKLIDEVKENENMKNENEERKENSKMVEKRSTGYFGELREDFPRFSQILATNSWQDLDNSRNSKSVPFFPVISDSPKNLDFYWAPQLVPVKRIQEGGGSNFIRFG